MHHALLPVSIIICRPGTFPSKRYNPIPAHRSAFGGSANSISDYRNASNNSVPQEQIRAQLSWSSDKSQSSAQKECVARSAVLTPLKGCAAIRARMEAVVGPVSGSHGI